jgi:hypothetical protein
LAVAPAEVREEAPHFRCLVLSSVPPFHIEPRLMSFFEHRSYYPAWDYPTFGRVGKRTPEVYETIKQEVATHRLVLRFHVPPAIASFLTASFHLNGSECASYPVGHNDVGIGDAVRRERSDFVSAQQLAHHIVLTRCAESPRITFLCHRSHAKQYTTVHRVVKGRRDSTVFAQDPSRPGSASTDLDQFSRTDRP